MTARDPPIYSPIYSETTTDGHYRHTTFDFHIQSPKQNVHIDGALQSRPGPGVRGVKTLGEPGALAPSLMLRSRCVVRKNIAPEKNKTFQVQIQSAWNQLHCCPNLGSTAVSYQQCKASG